MQARGPLSSSGSSADCFVREKMTPMSILFPAFFAGAVAILVTVAIEKWGGRVGGVIGTLPTTIVPAAIGIYGGSPDLGSFQDAMFMTPGGILLNAGFLLLWRLLPPRLPDWGLGKRLSAMIFLSLALWFAAAVLAVLSMEWVRSRVDGLEFAGVAFTLGIVICGVLSCIKSPPAPRGTRKVGAVALLSRGVLAAGAIAGAIWLASAGGAIAAGIASVFPAIFITAMVSLWWSQGEAVQAGAVGPMMLGAASVGAFAVFSAWTFPTMGILLGSIVSWFASAAVVTVPAVWWLRSMTAKENKMKEQG